MDVYGLRRARRWGRASPVGWLLGLFGVGAMLGCAASDVDGVVEPLPAAAAAQCVATGIPALGPGVTLVDDRFHRPITPYDRGDDDGVGGLGSLLADFQPALVVLRSLERRSVAPIVAPNRLLRDRDRRALSSAPDGMGMFAFDSLRAIRPGTILIASIRWPLRIGARRVVFPYHLQCGWLCDRSGLVVMRFEAVAGCVAAEDVIVAQS